MVKRRKKATKRRVKSSFNTTKGRVVGFTKVGKSLAFVFSKNGKKVVGKSRFKNRTTLKKRLQKILK